MRILFTYLKYKSQDLKNNLKTKMSYKKLFSLNLQKSNSKIAQKWNGYFSNLTIIKLDAIILVKKYMD